MHSKLTLTDVAVALFALFAGVTLVIYFALIPLSKPAPCCSSTRERTERR